MLTESDVNWIKTNRSEITAGRTESVVLVRIVTGEPDPYTGEPSTSETLETVDAVWKEFSTVTNGDRSVVAGVELRQDDVKVTFDATVDLTDVNEVRRAGGRFSIIATDEHGIGVKNRYVCVVRRVT
jgi:hypothetical protein